MFLFRNLYFCEKVDGSLSFYFYFSLYLSFYFNPTLLDAIILVGTLSLFVRLDSFSFYLSLKLELPALLFVP